MKIHLFPVRLDRRAAVSVLALALMVLPTAWAVAGGRQEGPVNTTDGVAIRGYDPVAYFTLGEATEGNAEYTFDWDGAEWHFASAEHRDLFAHDPQRYAPQYGGYCAFAAAQNQVADGDPALWTIHDDRLYLNLNTRVERQFRDDLPGNIAAATANWPGLRARLEAAADE